MPDFGPAGGESPAPSDAAQQGPSVRGWTLLAVPAISALLIVALVFALTILAIMVINPTPTTAVVQRYIAGLYRNPFAVQGLVIAQDVIVLASVWILLPRRGPASFSSYFPRVPAHLIVFAIASGAFTAFAVEIGVSLLASRHLVSFHATKLEQALVPQRAIDVVPALIAVGLAAPFAEELYFRGLLLRWLRKRLPFALSALLSAASFALIHFKFTEHVGLEGWTLTGGIFAIGLVSAGWAAVSRSLWPSIATHATYNIVIIGLPLLAMYAQKG